ncbi:MAG: nucleotide exchange factor GrpE [Anaerolineae bacterium]
MKKAVTIPVRVVRSADRRGEPVAEEAISQPITHEPGQEIASDEERFGDQASTEAAAEEPRHAEPAPQEADIDWQERALRLQAEMENYRRRQRRLAQDEIETERSRLLQSFLRVVDDLERALAMPAHDGTGLRQGILLTHRAALNLLKGEGVERMHPENQPFDPNWQEAISAVSHEQANASPGMVVQVVEPGYRFDGRLLRPAKVIVAV